MDGEKQEKQEHVQKKRATHGMKFDTFKDADFFRFALEHDEQATIHKFDHLRIRRRGPKRSNKGQYFELKFYKDIKQDDQKVDIQE